MDSTDVLGILLGVGRGGKVWLSKEQRELLSHFESCRTAARGCRIFQCQDCKTSMVLYNPCNKRGCPKCAQKNQMAWIEKAKQRILPTGHHHLVFSIPGCYTQDWMLDRSGMINQLFAGVDAVLKQIEQASGLLVGRMLVFQSHGRGMSYKPHIHCLLSDGGLDSNRQWKALGALALEKMTQALKDYFVQVDPKKAETEGWSVYESFHAENAEAVVEYLGRTLAGVVLRIDGSSGMNQNGELISFDDRHEGVSRETSLRQTTFVQRYLGHIPPRHTVTVRYYGLYSNRHRVDLQIARDQLDLFHRAHEEKPAYQELCPHCHRAMTQVFGADCGLYVDFTVFGLGNGPPDHREYRRAS